MTHHAMRETGSRSEKRLPYPGRQLFRVFLYQSLAEENLNFLEAVEKLKKMKNSDEKRVSRNEYASPRGLAQWNNESMFSYRLLTRKYS